MKRTTAIMAIVLTVKVFTSTLSPAVFAQQPALVELRSSGLS